MTVDLADYGHNEALTKMADYTATAGMHIIVRVSKAGITVGVSPNAADKIVGNGFTAAVNKDATATNQPPGSYIELEAIFNSVTDLAATPDPTTTVTTAWTVQRVLGAFVRET